MADGERFSGAALGSIAAGGLLVFAGIKGYSLAQTIQDVIKGSSPLKQTQTTPIAGTPAAGTSAAAAAAAAAGAQAAPQTGQAGTYSHAQLMTLWILAGGPQASANNAACHAIQESAGNPKVTSANPDGGTNVGLWQLDTPGGKGAGYSIAQLQNPLTNARVAVTGSAHGTDWSAWATPGC